MLAFELINGLVFGIEHMSVQDGEMEWLIAIHIGFIRIDIIKLTPKE